MDTATFASPFVAPVRTRPVSDVIVRRLGRGDYDAVRGAMRTFTEHRDGTTVDEIWLVEHSPVYTLGLAGKREHLLRETGIALVHTERGGQITYHGPGQVVAYVLVDLRRRDLKVRELVSCLEAALIETLASYHVLAERKPGAPGVYVRHDGQVQKIAALGLKVIKGCTFHGVSLNVDMDLTPFSWINPCGYPGLKSIDLARLGHKVDPAQAGERLSRALIDALGGKEME